MAELTRRKHTPKFSSKKTLDLRRFLATLIVITPDIYGCINNPLPDRRPYARRVSGDLYNGISEHHSEGVKNNSRNIEQGKSPTTHKSQTP